MSKAFPTPATRWEKRITQRWIWNDDTLFQMYRSARFAVVIVLVKITLARALMCVCVCARARVCLCLHICLPQQNKITKTIPVKFRKYEAEKN